MHVTWQASRGMRRAADAWLQPAHQPRPCCSACACARMRPRKRVTRRPVWLPGAPAGCPAACPGSPPGAAWVRSWTSARRAQPRARPSGACWSCPPAQLAPIATQTHAAPQPALPAGPMRLLSWPASAALQPCVRIHLHSCSDLIWSSRWAAPLAAPSSWSALARAAATCVAFHWQPEACPAVQQVLMTACGAS